MAGELFSTSTTNSTTTSQSTIESCPLPSDATPAEKPKPCCVCKDEKAQRDECMLFATSDDAQAECASMVDRYKACMAGFGFKI